MFPTIETQDVSGLGMSEWNTFYEEGEVAMWNELANVNFGTDTFSGFILHYYKHAYSSGTTLWPSHAGFVQGVCGQTIFNSVTLTEDIGPCSVPGIIIGADGITLDGDGYKIIARPEVADGVVLTGRSNVTIEHLFIKNFDCGIYIDGGNGNLICTNRLDNNGAGVVLSEGSTNTTVRRNIIADNSVGVDAYSSGNRIFHNLIINNYLQVRDVGGNTWQDSGLGNYWGNYWGKDTNGDFVGDTRLPHEGVDSNPLLDPSKWGGGYLCGDFLNYWGWLIWRGGWSPVEIQMTDPLGRIISQAENQIGNDAFYVEDEETEPGTKLVQVLVGINPLNPFEGVYSFQMTGLEDLTYSMIHFASDKGEILLHQSVEDVPLAAGETQHIDTSLEKVNGVIVAKRVVAVDIKPQSCPNPLNVKSKGVLPAAILGTADFDVTQVDTTSIKLEGVTPIRWALEDVATPFELFTGKKDAHDCTDEGPDGFLDLTLKFDTQEVVKAIGEVTDGEVLVLTLTGNLQDETQIQGEDTVVILKKGKKGKKAARTSLLTAFPSPGNPEVWIPYQLSSLSEVVIRIYDAKGQLVRTLNMGRQPAGIYDSKSTAAYWDGRNQNGESVASGIYFYIIRAGEFTATRKLLIVR